MNKITLTLLTLSLFSPFCFSITPKERKDVSEHLQDISVTIRAESEYSKSEGSGVLINRVIGKEKVTFVWTCGHVISNLRKVRAVITKGSPQKVVEFDDVKIIKELVEGGRRVGEIKMDATVIKFSDYSNGEDLALLMVRARDYGKDSTKFHLNKKELIIPIGTPLFHVGSLLGQMGANSMTSGIISQVGRIHGKVEFDQTTVAAFPGSSGGGVFLENGEYVGMIARGAGESFNLMIPIRRMLKWAKKHKIMWAIDPSEKMPSLEEIYKLPIENTPSEDKDDEGKRSFEEFMSEAKFLIKTEYK
tara:strand:+ start:502 stop:1413 length:912 start_codon:yes stop_codon:yes gene_type:complete